MGKAGVSMCNNYNFQDKLNIHIFICFSFKKKNPYSPTWHHEVCQQSLVFVFFFFKEKAHYKDLNLNFVINVRIILGSNL